MDILQKKLNSNDELYTLSIKSKNSLQAYVKDEIKLKMFKFKYKSYFDTVWVNNPIKLQIVLNSLNEDQTHTFFQIFDNFKSSEGSVSTIDASPGTGKTFLTACILMSYAHSALYMVYTNKLSESMNNLYFDGVSSTCCKFLMNILKLNYVKVKYLWYLRGMSLSEKCAEIEELAKNNKPFHNLYIMDENSVVSPFFIYFMFCLYKYHKIHIIFICNRCQQFEIGFHMIFCCTIARISIFLQNKEINKHDF